MLIEVDPKEKQIESINLSTKFIDEEMLVLYYALDLIMCDVQKVTDALKAITEYLQKQEISTLGKANIYKTLGCLLMLSELDSDVSYSMETLNLALTYFSALKQKRGVAFTKFSILKLYCLKWKILSSQNGGSNSSSDLYSEFQNSLVGKTAKNLGKECLLLFIELNDTVYQTKTTKLVVCYINSFYRTISTS